MNQSSDFRRDLAIRLLQIAGTVALALPPTPVGCGGKVAFIPEGDGAGGEGGANGTTSSTSSTAVSSSSSNPTSVSSGGQGGSTNGCDGKACFEWLNDGPCPAPENAKQYLNLSDCGMGEDFCWTEAVVDAINQFGDTCCYKVVESPCGVGRPFLVRNEVRSARVESKKGARGWTEGACPEVRDLTTSERATLAAAWERDAQLEHASVASFARFSLELLAVGAPADLVAMAHEAALDEVRHARLCFALASAYLGETLAPGAFPFDGGIDVSCDLAVVAANAAREGCIGETIAALQAAEQLEAAQDPTVKAALAIIAEDEARHAELAWRTVAWAVRVGGTRVRSAVDSVFAELSARRDRPAQAASPGQAHAPALLRHGRLDRAAAASVHDRGLLDVVLPAARALLRSSEPADA